MTRIITKGLIGLQDLALGTGTFTRATSTGGTITLNQISGLGLTGLAGSLDSTNLIANVVTQQIVSFTGTGMYKVEGYATITTPATTSSTMPAINITWTDADDLQSMSFQLTPTNTTNVTTAIQSAAIFFNTKPGTAISVNTSGYLSSGATAMAYSLHLRVEGPL